MQAWLDMYCKAFGYQSCAAMSTFEAMVVFVILLFAALFAVMVVGGIIATIFGR